MSRRFQPHSQAYSFQSDTSSSSSTSRKSTALSSAPVRSLLESTTRSLASGPLIGLTGSGGDTYKYTRPPADRSHYGRSVQPDSAGLSTSGLTTPGLTNYGLNSSTLSPSVQSSPRLSTSRLSSTTYLSPSSSYDSTNHLRPHSPGRTYRNSSGDKADNVKSDSAVSTEILDHISDVTSARSIRQRVRSGDVPDVTQKPEVENKIDRRSSTGWRSRLNLHEVADVSSTAHVDRVQDGVSRVRDRNVREAGKDNLEVVSQKFSSRESIDVSGREDSGIVDCDVITKSADVTPEDETVVEGGPEGKTTRVRRPYGRERKEDKCKIPVELVTVRITRTPCDVIDDKEDSVW